jgi:hypothetical protein
VSLTKLTFAMLVFPAVWDWYLQRRQVRRGFYTQWEVEMLMLGAALTRRETGWIRQTPDLAQRLKPISSLISQVEIDAARSDWDAACDEMHRHALHRAKEVARIARVHRDPFEPILAILEADSPLAAYRQITEEILARAPSVRRYPVPAAEACRSFLMLRFGLHLGVRQKNLRQLLICERGAPASSERRLETLKCGELRWNDREGAGRLSFRRSRSRTQAPLTSVASRSAWCCRILAACTTRSTRIYGRIGRGCWAARLTLEPSL